MIRRYVYIISDAFLIGLALFLAFLLRFGTDIKPVYMTSLFLLLPLAIVIKIAVFKFSGFYSQLWQYASLKELMRIAQGVLAATLLLLCAVFLIQSIELPRGILIIDWLLTSAFIGASRFLVRAKQDLLPTLRAQMSNHSIEQKRVIIVGAGQAGSMLVKQMQCNPDMGYKPVAFLDDNLSKRGLMIHGVKVVGSARMIPGIMADYPADEIIMAMPSAESSKRQGLACECRELGIPCKTIPDIAELVDGKVSVSQIRDIDPKEVLGRKEAEIDLMGTVKQYEKHVILITGAAGSIGSEICRQALMLRPKKVIATDISENGLYHLEEEIFSSLNGHRTIFEARVMDVRDSHAVSRIFTRYEPDIVFHAAAYKHVPMMERHPIEAMENNFLGTRVLIEETKHHHIKRLTLISTDKAVNPTSIMGLSKHLAEQSIRAAAREPDCASKFMAVRFGNVLGSNGSVIPKFKRQISKGEPITVTHPDITRYFMTIQEAVHLVIQATAMGRGGEVFVLDMGEPLRIVDLAMSVIRLSGLEPGRDVPIKFTGLRPGEKLYEELFAQEEIAKKTDHPQIFKVSSKLNENILTAFLNELEDAVIRGDAKRFSEYLNNNYLFPAA
ncbi:MAG TPA: nucleoside-diphosphate sugar epimerase/dehydratase [Candidatus Aquicultor sp.]|jgi:FlaA1/EpsC-like NDP-sugar epimerase